MIGLVDCNNFFVSCERVRRPELVGRPVIVLSNNDGCAVALSNEAKALGIKRGDPYFRIRRLCERQGVTALSGDHHFYSRISARVMKVLHYLAGDELQVYSIDEAFLPISPRLGDATLYGRYVVKEVLERTGVPVSLGIAPTKTLAKIAAHFAKKYSGYHSVCLIDSEDKRAKALQLTAIDDVWGIGRRLSKRLRQYGINTAWDFQSLTPAHVSQLLNITGMHTWRELHGEPCIEARHTPPERQSISCSRTLPRDVTSIEILRQAITSHCTEVCRKLRRNNLVASEITVYLRTNRFRTDAPQYSNTLTLRLPAPTDFTPDIVTQAVNALEQIFRHGYAYKKTGVTLTRLCSRNAMQGDLFTDPDLTARRSRLMQVVDSINAAHPRSITLAIDKPQTKPQSDL